MRLAIPPIILALALALLLVAPFAFLVGRRGGHHRSLPGWVGFWVFLAGLLVALARADRRLSFPLLGILMFMGLKQYFFVTPLRPQDRWAILVAYLSIPLTLWPAFRGNPVEFLATVTVLLLLFPFLVAMATQQGGFLDSAGRVLVGVLVFVVSAAHLGLMAQLPSGLLELFGLLAFISDLPQRYAGRLRSTGIPARTIGGVAAGAATGCVVGAALARFALLRPVQGAVLGLVVALAVAMGARIADAVAEDLDMSPSAPIVGRRAFLDRTIPALFAAPFFFLALFFFGNGP